MDQAQLLLDKDHIRDLVYHLFVWTDQRHWPGVRECFADEVLFDMTSLLGGEPQRMTPQQITHGWEQGLQRLQAIHHQAGNVLIDVRGDEADVFCYALASHYLRTQSGRNTRVFVGSYDLHAICKGNNWCIDRFKFNLKYIEGNPNLESEASG